MMGEVIRFQMQPVKGLAELARSLRVAAAVVGKEGSVSLPLSAEEARTFAAALERLDAFPTEVARFQVWSDAKVNEMRSELHKQVVTAIYMTALAAALIFSMWWFR